MTTAKNKALDRLRQHALHARKQEELGRDMDALENARHARFRRCARCPARGRYRRRIGAGRGYGGDAVNSRPCWMSVWSILCRSNC